MKDMMTTDSTEKCEVHPVKIMTGYHKVLQTLLLPDDTSIEALYIRYTSGYAEVISNVLLMQKNAKVSFNSYFNSFYESYWRELSDAKDVFLEIVFEGSIIVETFRDTKDYGCNRIGLVWAEAESQSTHKISINALSPIIGQTGRVFVDITARKNSRIHGLRFVTNSPITRQARLSIGICTFNREQFLLRNVRSLLNDEELALCLASIIVVNQGPSFTIPELAEIVNNSDRVLLIEQGNLGGCGGFTRTMFESLQLDGITHHVLMDDDAVIDARVLRNLASILSFCSADKVVGGHMLDMLRPHFLYEAGAMVKSNTRLRSLHHNIDLRALDALIPFIKYQEVDYNAWWFCAIPVKHIRKAGLPAPIFIRGDDMEYGIRLQELGVNTVAMPGIAVWHEPFYVKVGGWQTYYDLRNRLILASTYPHRFKHETPIDLLWWMLKAAASHDYLTSALLVRAVHDFLAGPSLFKCSADDIHADISALAISLAQQPVAENELPPPPAKLRCMPKTNFSLGLLVALRIINSLLIAKQDGATLLLDHEANLSNIYERPYVKTNAVGSYHLLYSPDKKRLLIAVRECFNAWRAYVTHRREAASAWHDQIPSMREKQFWQEIFVDDAAKRNATIQCEAAN